MGARRVQIPSEEVLGGVGLGLLATSTSFSVKVGLGWVPKAFCAAPEEMGQEPKRESFKIESGSGKGWVFWFVSRPKRFEVEGLLRAP